MTPFSSRILSASADVGPFAPSDQLGLDLVGVRLGDLALQRRRYQEVYIQREQLFVGDDAHSRCCIPLNELMLCHVLADLWHVQAGGVINSACDVADAYHFAAQLVGEFCGDGPHVAVPLNGAGDLRRLLAQPGEEFPDGEHHASACGLAAPE